MACSTWRVEGRRRGREGGRGGGGGGDGRGAPIRQLRSVAPLRSRSRERDSRRMTLTRPSPPPASAPPFAPSPGCICFASTRVVRGVRRREGRHGTARRGAPAGRRHRKKERRNSEVNRRRLYLRQQGFAALARSIMASDADAAHAQAREAMILRCRHLEGLGGWNCPQFFIAARQGSAAGRQPWSCLTLCRICVLPPMSSFPLPGTTTAALFDPSRCPDPPLR
eukprot:366574-Chlamydomonas_euryale.AAC.15